MGTDQGSGNQISFKIKHMFDLMTRLVNNEELYVQDETLQYSLFGQSGKSQERSLRRYLNDIHTLYEEMIVIEKKEKERDGRKVSVYRVANRQDVSDILKYFLEYDSDFEWILQFIHEQDPKGLLSHKTDAMDALKKKIEMDKDIFLFTSAPFEVFTEESEKEIFRTLKIAVKNHEYRTIYTKGKESDVLEDVKCLKLIYSQNNWYIALELETGKLKLTRLKFITQVKYSKKSNYQKNVLKKYQEYFLTFENPMTLEGKVKQKAVLKVSPIIAKYFEEDMKPYYKSQKFIKKYEDGSIEFSIDYTQNLEILPFVKRWVPEIEILSPSKLRDKLLDDLKYMVNMIESM